MPPKKRAKADDAAAGDAGSSVLDGCIFVVAGDLSKSAADVKKLIADNGGEVLTRFTAKVTHLLTVAGNPKIEEAAKKGVHCVSEDWLSESIAKKAKQDEKKYDLGGAAPAKRAADDDGDDGKKGKKAKKDEPDPAPAAAPAAAPSPKAAAPAEVEKKVKVIKKGKAPVDPTAGSLVSSHHVYSDPDGTVWDCMLNQTNIGQNNNKFYVIQVLEADGGGNFICFQRWGRVGEPGQNMKRPFSSVADAKSEFQKKFKDKSGNDWSNRSKFVSKPGKYTLIEIDYGNDDAAPAPAAPGAAPAEKKETVGSKLDPRVQDLIKMIFDIKMMEKTLVELEFDIKKMPLGKLTKKQVKDGYEVLKEIEAALNGGSKADLNSLSSTFYTLIPCAPL